jgi:hypothetical protein
MTTSCTDRDHPYYEEMRNLSSRKKVEFFTEDNGKRMRFVSLGEALDFVSLGGTNYVVYDLNPRGIVKFIRTWMKSQRPKREDVKINLNGGGYTWEEDVSQRQYSYVWNRFHLEREEELPRIKHEECPRNEYHKRRITDRGGTIRCGHIDVKILKPSFIDSFNIEDDLAQIKRTLYLDCRPYDPTPDVWEDEEGNPLDYSEEYEGFKRDREAYLEEEGVKVADACYAIISETPNKYLPLQTVLERLNLCSREEPVYVNPFSGFALANFVKAWWEQPGRKRVWRKKGEIDLYRKYPNFRLISSEE